MEEKSAGAVIVRYTSEGVMFLILNYPSGHWDFVKGKIEGKETLRQTVLRETKEETGISDLEFIDGFEETIEYNFQFKGEMIYKKVIFFLANTKTEKITLSHEHLDYTWLNFKDAKQKITYDNARSILSKAEQLLAKTL
jgi:8-oxo-dGTP pyrophosphatase MutT (NUDIX family)